MSQNPFLLLCVFLIAAFVLLVLIVIAVTRLHDFRRELLFINTEIGRSSKQELPYWKKRKKHLWLSLIPFFPYKKR